MLAAVCTIIFLVVGSYFDVKKLAVPVWLLFAGGGVGLLGLVMSGIFGGGTAVREGVAGIVPGMGLLGLSFLTDRKVGRADGIALAIIGVWEGMEGAFLLFCTALFFQSLAAVVLLALKKASLQGKIPFLPFLLGAKVVLVFGNFF